MSEHVHGPALATSPHAAVRAAHMVSAALLGVAGRGEWFVTEELLVALVDRKAPFVAAGARKLTAAFAAACAKLKKPDVQAVLLLGAEQPRLCSKLDTPARAHCLLAAARVAVYRLRAD